MRAPCDALEGNTTRWSAARVAVARPCDFDELDVFTSAPLAHAASDASRTNAIVRFKMAVSTIELQSLAHGVTDELAAIPGQDTVDPGRGDARMERRALEGRPSALRQH